MVALATRGTEADMDLKMFGARLKELREAAGLSQKQLAEKSGLSQGGVAHWEKGIREPGWLAILALAKALDVDCKAFEEEPEDAGEPKRGRPRKDKAADRDVPKKPRKGKGK